MRLSAKLLALAGLVQSVAKPTDHFECIICEHIGYAETQDDAQTMLMGPITVGANTYYDYCVHAQILTATSDIPVHVKTIGSSTYSYCVAQFFVYYAKDLGKYVYGVKRYGSTANVNPGLIDADGFDGVKAFQYSIALTDTTNIFGASSTGTLQFGPNPLYKRRNYGYLLDRASAPTQPFLPVACPDACDATHQIVYFMGDGREDETASTVTDLTITPVQETPYTRCIICHGTQEFQTPPAISSEITDACWNPSGSTVYATDHEATVDPRKFCKPQHGFCKTTTWQYSTREDSGSTSSHWVGIERGCPEDTISSQMATADTTGVAHTTKRGATGMKEYVRYYAASNTASKAKDNAKYPDADVANNVAVALDNGNAHTQISTTNWQDLVLATSDLYGYGYVSTSDGSMAAYITPQFMSADGSGKPDFPVTVLIEELECLSCVTPIGNTDSTNTCVNAKTAGRVKCKTLSCSSVTANYYLGDSSDKYYYAKRGCDADPEDGTPDGEQDPADLAVVPAGWTNIKQYNQRTTTKNGNTGRSSSTSTAKVFDCYSCESHFFETVEGNNPSEPLYDAIKTKDTSLCWETYEPQTDTSIASTGTSGACIGNCFTSAYKYKETSGPVTNPTTIFHWYVNRGCAAEKTSITSGTTPSTELYGVTVTNSVCTFQNGTLCNGKIEAYDTSLELQTQNVRKLQCYSCETPAGNENAADDCYTVPSTAKAAECDDLSYVACFATQTSFSLDGATNYGMKRGCSTSPAASTTTAVEGYTNVNAVTTSCSSSSCNKIAGKTDGLVEAVAGGDGENGGGGGEETSTDVNPTEVTEVTAGAMTYSSVFLTVTFATILNRW